MKALKVRIYPDEEQVKFLEAQFGAVRFVYNKALFIKKHLYQFHQINVRPIKDLKPLLTIAKKSRKYQWLKEFDSIALQQAVINVDMAYKNFFNPKIKARFPVFKRKHGRQSSYHCTSVKVSEEYIKIPKLNPIKAKIHRKTKGTLKSITVSKTTTGKWFASLLFDDVSETIPITNIKNVLGIDLGLSHLLTTCNGYLINKIDNPRFLKKTENNLRRKQKQLSRKIKWSHKRKKARLKLANIHEKLANTRNDFQHKLTRTIVDENQAVIVENLSSANMLKNERLAKAISDVAWNRFVTKLQYKLKEQGKYLIKVDRWFASSKICNECGHKLEELKLSTRKWSCPSCKAIHDRDINASINIRNEGIVRLKAEGLFVSAHRGLCKTSQVEAVA